MPVSKQRKNHKKKARAYVENMYSTRRKQELDFRNKLQELYSNAKDGDQLLKNQNEIKTEQLIETPLVFNDNLISNN